MNPDVDSGLNRFSTWFYAAAIYNLVWGLSVVLFPSWIFRFTGVSMGSAGVYWQIVGMFVLVYAPAYYWAARRPEAHAHLILIGALGKVLGPIGFAWAVLTSHISFRFGLVILTNDLLWWPAFALFLRAAAPLHGGWWAFLRGK